MDRFYVTARPMPINWKQKLKPLFAIFLPKVNFDEAYDMDMDDNPKKMEATSEKWEIMDLIIAMKILIDFNNLIKVFFI